MFDWASDSLKAKSDCSYNPKEGEIGVIKYASPNLNDRIGINNILYLVDFNGHMVAIGCGYIVDVDSLSLGEFNQLRAQNESLANEDYANGCGFKTSFFKGGLYEAGVFSIDKMAETFACQLLEDQVDTILLFKVFYEENHKLGFSEYEAVIWRENDVSTIKLFQQIEEDLGLPEAAIIDLSAFFTYFEENNLGLKESRPIALGGMSSQLIYSIQYMRGDKFYTDSFSEFEVQNDPSNRTSIWVAMLLSVIEENFNRK